MSLVSDENGAGSCIAPGKPSPDPRRALREALLVWAAATLLCALFYQLGRVWSLIGDNVHALVAAVFLYLPTLLLLRRDEDFALYGLTARPIKRGLILFAAASLVVFPLFAVGLYGYYSIVCAGVRLGYRMPTMMRAMCSRFVGSWRRARWRLPPSFAQMVLAQVVVVALPEEYFFRGYLQSRLETRWPSRRRLLGAPVGPSLVIASLLFGIGHPLVDFNPLRLAVFFPGLVFGWMRQATGSILAGTLFHAASNLVSEMLHKMLF